MYKIFREKQDACIKVVMKPGFGSRAGIVALALRFVVRARAAARSHHGAPLIWTRVWWPLRARRGRVPAWSPQHTASSSVLRVWVRRGDLLTGLDRARAPPVDVAVGTWGKWEGHDS